MTDRLDVLGRRAGAALRGRADGLDVPDDALPRIRGRAARPPAGVTAGMAVLLLLAVVGVAWLVRVNGAGPVEGDPDGQALLDAGPGGGWEAVGADAFGAAGVVSVRGLEVADGTVVAVGGDARNGREGMVGAAVWRSADGREWQRVAGGRIDGGRGRFAEAASTMTDVAVTEHEGGSRLVAVGWAQSHEVRVPVVWLSDDLGASWRWVEPEAVEGRLEAVAASPEGIVAVGSAGGESGSGGAGWVSADGERWERQAAADLGDIDLVHSVAAAGGRFVAAAPADPGAPVLWTSADGRSWQPGRVEPPPEGRLLLSRVVAADDSGFLAVGTVEPPGEAGTHGVVLRSPDGRTWRPAAEPTGIIGGDGHQRVHDIAADGVGLVAVGVDDGDPVVWHSRHGRGWEVGARGDHLLAEAGADAGAAMTRLLRVPAGLLAIGSVTDPSERAVVWLDPADWQRAEPTPPVDPTGVRLVASSDTRLTVVDLDATDLESTSLDELAGGDPPWRLVRRGDALVFFGAGGDTYVVDPDEPDRPRKLGDSTYFVPSADEERVWLVDGAAGTDSGNRLREVTVDGEVTVAARDAPSGTAPLAAVPGGVVRSAGEDLEVWDPEADDVVARFPGGRFVAAGEALLAWCPDACTSLHIAAFGGDSPLPPEVDERGLDVPDGRWVGHGAFAPGGGHVAVAVAFDGGRLAEPDVEFHLAVVDVADGDVTVLPDAGVEAGPFAWSPDGRWLFAPTTAAGMLVHDTERDRTEVRALDLGAVYGLATVE